MAFLDDILLETSPGYFIYRDSPPDRPYDPTAPPVFYPPKNSDELFDALRTKFPYLKTHSERMRDAIIEFLMEERQAELLQNASPVIPTDTTSTSPWQSSWPSMSSNSGSSSWNSPESFELSTPNFANSPQPQAPQLSHQLSRAGSSRGSMELSPPALEQMTAVFSLSSTEQPKQRMRRKMTEAEKIEYRKRRIVKACETCAKRKRKCPHNQSDMEILTAKSAKVMKPQAAAVKKPSASLSKVRKQQIPSNFETLGFEDPVGADIQLFDDFTNFFDEPMPEINFDENQQFDHLLGISPNLSTKFYGQSQWPGSSVQGFSPITNDSQDGTAMNLSNSNEALNFNRIQQAPDSNMVIKTEPHPLNAFSPINTSSQGDGRQQPNGNGMLWERLSTGQVKKHQHQKELHSPNAFSTINSGSQGDGRQQPNGNDMLWERLHTVQAEKPRSRHTLHVHDSSCRGAYTFDGAGGGGPLSDGPQCLRTALAQIVLRLIGTTKAVRAFGSLLNPCSLSSARSVSIGRVANAVIFRDSQSHSKEQTNDFLLSGVPGLHSSGHTDGHLLEDANDVPLRRPNGLFHDGSQKTTSSGAAHLPAEADAHGPLEGMSIGDYLRMMTNFSDAEKTSSRASTSVPAIRKTQKQAGFAALEGATSEGWTSASVPILNEALQSEDSAAEAGRPAVSLGEGITQAACPSTELYRLKRRIPKALHSIVDRNHGSLNVAGVPRRTGLSTTPSSSTSSADQSLQTASGSLEGNIHPNRGAYLPRLDTNTYTQPAPSLSCDMDASQRAAQRVHKHSRNPRANGFSWDLDRSYLSSGDQSCARIFAENDNPLTSASSGDEKEVPPLSLDDQQATHSTRNVSTIDTRNGGRNIRLGQGRGGWPETASKLPASMALTMQSGPRTERPMFSNYSLPPVITPEQADVSSRRTIGGGDVRIGLAPRASPRDEQGKYVERANRGHGLGRDAEMHEGGSNLDITVEKPASRFVDKYEETVYELRKRDTKRYRDHNGEGVVEREAWREVVGVVMAVGLLTIVLSNFSVDTSLLLLALASPVSGTRSQHFRDRAWRHFFSHVWGAMLQCTVKNRSWLAPQNEHARTGTDWRWWTRTGEDLHKAGKLAGGKRTRSEQLKGGLHGWLWSSGASGCMAALRF